MLPTVVRVGMRDPARALGSSRTGIRADAAGRRTPLDHDRMPTHPRHMRLLAATIAGALLFGASFALLVWANEPTDATAVAGGTGVVLAGALLGLTFLAWRWRGSRAFVSTAISDPSFYDDLATAFDETTEGYGDEPMRAAN